MASGRLADYLGKGDAAERPVTLDLHPEAVGFYYAEDTGEWSAWDGTQWLEDIMAAGAVASVNGQTGAVVLALDDLDDVGAAAPANGDVLTWSDSNSEWEPQALQGGGIPDAPSDGKLYGRKDAAWEEVPVDGSETLTIVTEASAFTASPATHAGLSRYIRAGGDVTFDDGEGYTAGQVFNIRATATLELIEDGVTLTPTYGGTLDLEEGMAVTVVVTSPTTADVIGLTVQSS